MRQLEKKLKELQKSGYEQVTIVQVLNWMYEIWRINRGKKEEAQLKKRYMKVLIACEESQEVCKAFRLKGHEAFSCDLMPCSGGHPEWHIQGDAIKALWSRKWDLVIAHPSCQRLANSGVRWIVSRKPKDGYEWDEGRQIYFTTNEKLIQDLFDACRFFNQFILYGNMGNKIAIENPIQHKYAKQLITNEQTQIIQPWQFGHGETKATCLWLYNLPILKPEKIVTGRDGKVWKMSPGPERSKLRSKTYPGIAAAMANQWG